MMRAKISCSEGCKLDQLKLALQDEAGCNYGAALCSPSEGDTFDITSNEVRITDVAGTYLFNLISQSGSQADCKSGFTSQFTVFVRPHAARLNVWGVPSAVTANEEFSFNIGLKCSSACDLSGQTILVKDHDGNVLLEQALGSDIWPGTEALQFLKVSVKAPVATGIYEWTASSSPEANGLAHAAGETSFRFHVTQQADCEILVEVRELSTEIPLENATVVLHPFRCKTDTNGVARFKVPSGDYDLLVSCSKHMPSSTIWSVSGNAKTDIVLAPDAPWTPHEEA